MPVKLTQTIKVLLGLNVGIFIIQQSVDRFLGGNLTELFGLVPNGVILEFRIWQLFTYAFLHADPMHLIFNMIVLVVIAGELESMWGRTRFLRFYFFCAAAAGLLYLFFQLFVTGGLGTPMVGASGAIFGLIAAWGLLFSERTILLFFVLPMKASQAMWVLAGVEFLFILFSPSGGLSSVAHLGGMAAGLAYLWGAAWWKARQRLQEMGIPTSRSSRRKVKDRSHLRVVPGEKDDSDPTTWH